MADDDDPEALKEKMLCFRCVDEAFLRKEIRAKGKKAKCSYCDNVARAYSIDVMSERTEAVFEEHYTRTSDQPTSLQYTMMSDRESSYDWERDGEEVVYAIMNAAQIPEDAAGDIQKILEDKFSDYNAAQSGDETAFSSESYYEEKGPNDARWQDEWRVFERSLKTEARFFSQSAARHLASVFDDIESMKTRDGRSLVIDAGPGTKLNALYRARAFQADGKLEIALTRPDKHLGSPPSADASAGRMNARGISVFYGSNNPKVALAEVRPPVGSQVAVARFEIIRPIRVLDLTVMSEVKTTGSIFDPSFGERLERTTFLQSLSRRITMPVMPDDETFEYLPTQAIADFLATERTPQIDGIIFPSIQAAGGALNVVLFHKAARVGGLALPKGAEVSASLGNMYEEGWDVDYTVIERVLPEQADPPSKKEFPIFENFTEDMGEGWQSPSFDGREATLRIDLESVNVHIVQAVEFKTTEYTVRRLRMEKYGGGNEPDF